VIIAIVNLHFFPSFNINIYSKGLPKEYFIEHFQLKGDIQEKLFNVGSRELGVQFSLFYRNFTTIFQEEIEGFQPMILRTRH